MAKDEIHVGDTPTLEHTIRDGSVIVDISSATTNQIILLKPDGTTKLTKAGSFTTNGTDGKTDYTAITSDLDVKGTWKTQAFIVLSDGTWHTDIKEFNVFPNL